MVLYVGQDLIQGQPTLLEGFEQQPFVGLQGKKWLLSEPQGKADCLALRRCKGTRRKRRHTYETFH
jgi:hypothetical protein